MSKWEYLFLTVDLARTSLVTGKGEWKVVISNGREVPSWKDGEEVHDYCNRLGDAGWEMVNFSHSPVFSDNGRVARENFRIVLKRPK